jgi:hypothetical protein
VWTIELISIGFDFDKAMRASQTLGAYLREKIESRRQHLSDDYQRADQG